MQGAYTALDRAQVTPQPLTRQGQGRQKHPRHLAGLPALHLTDVWVRDPGGVCLGDASAPCDTEWGHSVACPWWPDWSVS